jgi:type I restriction enzyme M protein
MWGAIVGDIIGSSFENENHRSPYFELFCKGSRFTDDTVCTAAVADILEKIKLEDLTEENISDQLRLWCCTYLTRGFGSMFYQWVTNGINRPYGSYGNGALMRISPVVKFAIKNSLIKEEMLKIANLVTRITHNHPQALNAVEAYTSMIYDLLKYKEINKINMPLNEAKSLILGYFVEFNISKPLSIEKYRINTDFDLTCNTSLGISCAAILETNSFEDTMFQVVSAGGDSDTYAAIAGVLAESIYGIPDEMMQKIKPFFKEYDKNIILVLDKLYDDKHLVP